MPKTPPPVPNASGGGVSPGLGVTPGAASHGSAGGADGLSPMAIEKKKRSLRNCRLQLRNVLEMNGRDDANFLRNVLSM